MICPLCEHGGSFFRIGCPYCFNKDSSKIELLLDEEEIRAELCLECNTYIKSFKENHYMKYRDPFLIDLVSLPLDIVVQKRGYIRRSPNIVGLRRIKVMGGKNFFMKLSHLKRQRADYLRLS